MGRFGTIWMALVLGGCGGGEDIEPVDDELAWAAEEAATEEPAAPDPAVSPSGYREVEVRSPGTIEGRVRWEGPGAPEPVEVRAQVRACGRSQPSPVLRVGRGGELADAVAWIEGIEEGRPVPRSTAVPVMDQSRCRYTPHVLAVLRGSEVDFRNGDPVLHNVHAFWGDDEEDEWFNIGQPMQGMVTRKRVERSGVAHVVCDAGHTWMRGWIHAFDHPYFAVSDAQGAFRIEGVPPGRHTLHVWHASPSVVGTRDGRPVYAAPIVWTEVVTVAPGAAVPVQVVLRPAS